MIEAKCVFDGRAATWWMSPCPFRLRRWTIGPLTPWRSSQKVVLRAAALRETDFSSKLRSRRGAVPIFDLCVNGRISWPAQHTVPLGIRFLVVGAICFVRGKRGIFSNRVCDFRGSPQLFVHLQALQDESEPSAGIVRVKALSLWRPANVS